MTLGNYYYSFQLHAAVVNIYTVTGGTIGVESVENETAALRPCIALSSLVKASSGDGTATSPFIIS